MASLFGTCRVRHEPRTAKVERLVIEQLLTYNFTIQKGVSICWNPPVCAVMTRSMFGLNGISADALKANNGATVTHWLRL